MRQSDLDLVYSQYHWIARYYHWGRLELKQIPIRERQRWVDKIIEHEKMLKGVQDPLSPFGGDE